MNIRIITDSAADFSSDVPSCVTILPMTIRFNETEYLDGVTIDHQTFYEKLIEEDTLPVTSLVSPDAFAKAFQAAVEAGETVIAVTISSKLSGTCQSAMIAAAEYPGKVYVIDSLTATVGEQILVRYGAQLIEKGYDAQDIVNILNEKKQQILTMGMVDTLEYLKKGGRISSAAAAIGDLLKIKVVAGVEDGSLAVWGKARGSRNGNNFLIKQVQATNGIDFDMPVCLGYAGLSDASLQKYIKDSRELYQGHEDCIRIITVGAAVGTHLGPGALLVAFFIRQ